MYKLLLILFVFQFLSGNNVFAQKADSTLDALQQIPLKYISGIDKKITQYTNRITSKTEKTLTKLSRWENKIKNLLQKASPETAERLFGNNQLTFTSLLQQLKHGEGIALQYQETYNKYRDDVTTSLKYLAQQKEQLDSGVIKKILVTKSKMQQLATEEDKSEAIQEFINERKRQLLEQAFQQIGKSKYLTKINKEAYYYVETLKNYKELFSDSKKAEETAKIILNKIPAFQQFMKQNSMLSSLFSMPGNTGNIDLGGLQTRASMEQLLQAQFGNSGVQAAEAMHQNVQAARNQMDELKNKVAKMGENNSDAAMPDFKPKKMKSKTFLQRTELGTNFQTTSSTQFFPVATNVGLSVAYKLDDKNNIIGIGAAYKFGLGRGWDKIQLTGEGVGLRSFFEWRLKASFFIAGGYEMNYLKQFTRLIQLKNYVVWQRSCLFGISKTINTTSKIFKKTKVQLLYDFLWNKHLPQGQELNFRIGYNF